MSPLCPPPTTITSQRRHASSLIGAGSPTLPSTALTSIEFTGPSPSTPRLVDPIAAATSEMGDDAAVSNDRDPIASQPAADERRGRLRRRVRRADSKPQFVATARLIRQLLPGDERYGDALSTTGGAAPDRIGRLVSEAEPDRPSAMRELSLGALQAWQALSEAQGRGRGMVDVAVLFTDIVGFSSWALESGDEPALELVRRVASAEDAAISAHGGSLVKRLGDGSMSVFRLATAAGRRGSRGSAGCRNGRGPRTPAEDSRRCPPGRPRRVGRDYLGVDVNIAARVAQSAKGGEVLVSAAACEHLDPEGFAVGRSRRLSARGAPRGLAVCPVSAR